MFKFGPLVFNLYSPSVINSVFQFSIYLVLRIWSNVSSRFFQLTKRRHFIQPLIHILRTTSGVDFSIVKQSGFSVCLIFGIAAMPFLCRGVWVSTKLSYHRYVNLVVYLPMFHFSFCQKTNLHLYKCHGKVPQVVKGCQTSWRIES